MCFTCDTGFARKDHLRRHQATHNEERKFKCMVCPDNRSFKRQNDLTKHMVRHYEPKFSCTQCGKKFYTSGDLSTHMKYHFEPTYSCRKCGKKSYTLSDLKKHEKRKLC